VSMNRLHLDPLYQKQSQGLHQKHWHWSLNKTGITTKAEIELLRGLSLHAFKLAKFLEDKSAPKADNLYLFNDCSANKHDVKAWVETGYTIKGRHPIMSGVCRSCSMEVTNYNGQRELDRIL
jgi:hypothetical protein